MQTTLNRDAPASLSIDLPARPGAPGAGTGARLEIELDRGKIIRRVVADAERRQAIVAALESTGIAAVVPAQGRLIGNLSAWENIVLPLAYRDAAPARELEMRAESLFAQSGCSAQAMRAIAQRLPDRLSVYERRLVAFVRAMLAEPEVMVLDAVADGLPRADACRALGFAGLFRRHFPFRTTVHLEPERPAADDSPDDWESL